jgi:LEA14-like dessication related protein
MKNAFAAKLLIAVSLVFAAACAKPLQPEYLGFEKFRINKAGISESLVSADVKFYNPNHFPLQFKQADLNLFLNEREIAHCSLDTTIQIPKLDSFYVPVSFTIKLANIFGSALQSLLGNKARLNAEGFLKFKKSGIAFNVPVHYQNSMNYTSLDSLFQSIF